MNRLRMGFAAVVIGGALVSLNSAEALAQKRQRDRITREEILASPHKELDLYQLIRNMRPHFLAPPPGVRSFGNSVTLFAVYVDGRMETGVDALKLMSPLEVEEVRYFEPSRAQSEFGPKANGGAVAVKRFKGPKPAGAATDTTKPPSN